MPEPSLYKAGYHLKENQQLAGYTLTKLDVGHVVVKRYHDYSYPTKMTWTGGQNPQGLLSAITAQVEKDREINSSYGNPYLCSFGALTMNATNSKRICQGPFNKRSCYRGQGELSPSLPLTFRILANCLRKPLGFILKDGIRSCLRFQ